MLSAMEFMEGSLPLRVFHRIIDSERLNPMLIAMTRTTKHMPTLKYMRLSVENNLVLDVDSSRATSVCLEIREKKEMMTTMRKSGGLCQFENLSGRCRTTF